MQGERVKKEKEKGDVRGRTMEGGEEEKRKGKRGLLRGMRPAPLGDSEYYCMAICLYA